MRTREEIEREGIVGPRDGNITWTPKFEITMRCILEVLLDIRDITNRNREEYLRKEDAP